MFACRFEIGGSLHSLLLFFGERGLFVVELFVLFKLLDWELLEFVHVGGVELQFLLAGVLR